MPLNMRVTSVPTTEATATQTPAATTPLSLAPIVGQQVRSVTQASMDAPQAACEALVVIVHCASGSTRRRVYLSLTSAQRAVDRSLARGVHADLVLARLVPVPVGDQ